MNAVSESVSSLPDDWEWKKLADVVDILDSRRVPINAKERATRQGDVPYYGATGQVGYIDDFIFDEELVLLGEDGAPFFDPSKQKAYVIRGKSWVNNHAHVLRGKDGIQNVYIKHYLDHFDYHGYVTGTTRLKLNQGRMKEIPIPIAPKEQRERIVAEIEKQFSRLDEAVASLKRVTVNLKRYKAAVLKAAVEGKLTEEWRKQNPDVEPASKLLERILVERRAKWEQAELAKMKAKGKEPKNDKWKDKYKESSALSEAESKAVPAGWVLATVEQLAAVGTGATPLKSNKAYYDGGDIPWVTSGALNDDFVREAEGLVTQLAIDETNIKLFPVHSLLVAMYGEGKTRGKVSELLIEATTNQACAALVFDELSKGLKDYVKLFFQKNYDDIRRLSSGGVQPNLNLGLIKGTKLPVPPLEEQLLILDLVEQKLSVISEIDSQLASDVARVGRLRQSVLAQAFSRGIYG